MSYVPTHADAVKRLRDAWPREPFPDVTIAIDAERLSGFPADAVMASVNDLLTEKWRPSIGQLTEAIAERALNLPTVEEAWTIAERGSLRDAPEPVRAAVEYVGGRWAILHGDNATTTRAQFRQAYLNLRQTAISDYVRGGRPPQLALTARPQLGATMASLPESERYQPRPVQSRWLRRVVMQQEVGPPTDEEKADAIAVIGAGSWANDPADDPLYAEAERIFAEASA
jgi:hypothetical protein